MLFKNLKTFLSMHLLDVIMKKGSKKASTIDKERNKFLIFNLMVTLIIILIFILYALVLDMQKREFIYSGIIGPASIFMSQFIILGLLVYWVPHLILTEFIIFWQYVLTKKGMIGLFDVPEGEKSHEKITGVLYYILCFNPPRLFLFVASLVFMIGEFFIGMLILSGLGHRGSPISSLEQVVFIIFLLLIWLPTIIAIEPFRLPIFKKLKSFISN